jgi:hypothetical protein
MTTERYAVGIIVSFLCDCTILGKRKNKKVTKSLKDIGSVNILKYFTIIYGLPYHEQQLGLEGPIK